MAEGKILVVEDHDILREGLQILLEMEGYTVFTAIHGRDALRQMDRANPDLILSDIAMPEMDGYEFYEAVRARPDWMAIPFVFVTAHGDRDEVFASKRLGVEDYLVKPINRQDLMAVVHSRLERSQQMLLAQAEKAYEAGLIMLANAIELRDKYTRGHVERVMELSLRIARQMGWNQADLRPLRFGSILHDIGKIYISESILGKPGALTPDEWVEMRRHTIIGAELLAPIPYLAPAAPVVLSHHERWDGQGYPHGLKGDEIPPAARIVAVADCYDAMTTVRVYHNASRVEAAVEEILQNRGVRYDPAVVDAFMEICSG